MCEIADEINCKKLENVAVANALQLEAAWRFNYDIHANTKVAQPTCLDVL